MWRVGQAPTAGQSTELPSGTEPPRSNISASPIPSRKRAEYEAGSYPGPSNGLEGATPVMTDPMSSEPDPSTPRCPEKGNSSHTTRRARAFHTE